MKKILAILRTSTVQQEINSQKLEVIEFCLEHKFNENEIEFVEYKGASARKQNDKYLAMLDEIKYKIETMQIKNVALWHLNRLGRTEENLSTMKEYFERNHIQVFIKNPSLTLFDKDGNLNIGTSMAWTMFAMMIKFDTEELMQKLKRGKEYMKSKNKYYGGAIPFGYYVGNDGNLLIDYEESKIVKMIFEMYAYKNLSTSQISKELNLLGLKTKRNKVFDRVLVSYILRNSLYLGNERLEQIIDNDLFDKCRKKSSHNVHEIVKEKEKNIGTKKIFCSMCSRKCIYYHNYHLSGGKKYYYYSIFDYKYIGCINDDRVTNLKKDLIDFILWRSAVNIYSHELVELKKSDIEKLKGEIIVLQDKIKLLNKQINDNEKKIVRLNTLYIDGKYEGNERVYNEQYNELISNRTDYRTLKLQLENKIESISNQISVNENKDSISQYFEVRKNLWFEQDKNLQKEIFDKVISKVFIKVVELLDKKYIAIIVNSCNNVTQLYLIRKGIIYMLVKNEEGNFYSIYSMSGNQFERHESIGIDIDKEKYQKIINIEN